jgi:hypothetical protein
VAKKQTVGLAQIKPRRLFEPDGSPQRSSANLGLSLMASCGQRTRLHRFSHSKKR